MSLTEITRIERERCPVCHAARWTHCRKVPGETGTRIWPWHPGSAGPDWCHVERRDAAVANGHIAA